MEEQEWTGSDGWAVCSLTCGMVSLVGWILPICGGPTSLVGLVVGIQGLRGRMPGVAVAGLLLSGLGMALAMANATLGALMFLGAQ